MQEAEVAHPPIAARQHMDHQPPEELGERQRTQALLSGFAVLVTEGDGASGRITADDLFFGADAAVQVAGEILECWQSVTDVLALHDPACWGVGGKW